MKVAPGCHLCESGLSHVLFQNAHSSPVDVTNRCFLLPLSLCQHGGPVPKQGDFYCSIWWLSLRSAVGTAILSWACPWAGEGPAKSHAHRREALLLGPREAARITKCGTGPGPCASGRLRDLGPSPAGTGRFCMWS